MKIYMKKRITTALLALFGAFGGNVHATPLEEIRDLPVSRLEFSAFKLEVALGAIKDWPSPIEGVGVSYKVDPDRVLIVVATKIERAESFRAVCADTLARVREFLYVSPKGEAPMGRSYLGSYFQGPWRGATREAALRTLDASTFIRVDVVKRGSCHAALIKAPVTFVPLPSK